ncbi:MAG: hypothetical protein ACU0A6_05940 [Shimia sp.]|uniref:hypothetical protein n=1 Tax=Shimia sp. TaxID=1954381 RepID=UPI0040590638
MSFWSDKVVGIFNGYESVTLFVICLAHVGAVWVYNAFPKTSRWLLDFSSGLGIGYAFLYLLPKIGILTGSIRLLTPDVHILVEHRLYFMMLFGFLVYYLVEFKGHSATPSRLGLALNVLSFSIYSGLIGATVVHLDQVTPGVYFVSAVVFTLHLFGVNSFLFRMYPAEFSRWMRWVFIVAMAAGAYVGTEVERYDPYHSAATALVGGIIIILSVRLKLPARARLNTKAFLFGIATSVCAVAVYAQAGAL